LNDFDRYLESFFGESPFTPALRNLERMPAVNIQESSGAYLLEAELPGYDEKDIQIHVDGRNLTIESKRDEERTNERDVSPKKDAKKEIEPRYMLRERRLSSFSRSFQLPEDADFNAITAAFKNGLLTMEIRKRPEAQKRVIEISRK
jgi:HSP20 family protein